MTHNQQHIQWNVEMTTGELYRNACHLRELMRLLEPPLAFRPGDNIRMARYKLQATLDVMDGLISKKPAEHVPVPFESPAA